MTLDEARDSLGVSRAATVEEIRDAFRRRAREVHPDRHPSADAAQRARFAREFDRAREARDILVRFTGEPARSAAPASAGSSSAHAASSAGSRPTTTTTAPPRERARPRTSETRRPAAAPRVTMRFDEFVSAADAEGFGIGRRTRRLIDWPRVIAWSTVGVAVALVFGGSYIVTWVL